MAFRSDRLIFSLLQVQDAELYFSLMESPEVMQYITGRALTRTEARERFEGLLKINREESAFGTFGVYLLDKQTFIGIAKFVPLEEGVAEIGYALVPDFWGRGFGSEISTRLVRYGATVKGLRQLEAVVDPVNKASKRILEKCHFRYFGKKEVNKLPGEVYRMELKARQVPADRNTEG